MLVINNHGKRNPAGERPASIWTRNFILLCLANFSTFISMQMLLPTLPLYLLMLGGTQRDVGYVMGTYTLGAMLMRIIAGWLVDRYDRKRTLIIGIALMLAVTLLYNLVSDVPLITVIRALHGLTYGLVGTVIGTMVVDSLPSARIGEGIGYFGLTPTLSMAVAPILGLWLAGTFSYHVLFLAVSVLNALTILSCLPVRRTIVRTAPRFASISGTLANLFEKTAMRPAVVTFFLTAVYSAVIFFIAVYAAALGIGNIGLFFVATALTMVIFRPISGRWADRGGTNMVMFISYLALFLSIVIIGVSHSITGFLLAGAFIGLGFGSCFPTLQALAVRHVPAHRRGSATGTFFLAFDIGLGLGAVLWGYVAEAAGYQIMYFATLIPLVLAGAIYYGFRKRMAAPPAGGML
ncbi:MAG: MFS transporter [Syntrophales bacterium]|nr:MFS transporter [Syntrophales bacterium]